MHYGKKRKMVLAVMLLAVVGLTTSGYLWYDSQSEVFAAREYYSKARETAASSPQLTEGSPTDAAVPTWAAAGDNYIAWLSSPSGLIDYPVVRARDYEEYLYRLPDGTPSAYGSLFLEPLCSPDFSNRLNIIYGHNMDSDEMFGSLARYKSQDYYERNPVMHLSTLAGDYLVRLQYGFVITTGVWVERDFILQENTDALLSYAMSHTTFDSENNLAPEDRILVLSTCSIESMDSRYVLVGKLEKKGVE